MYKITKHRSPLREEEKGVDLAMQNLSLQFEDVSMSEEDHIQKAASNMRVVAGAKQVKKPMTQKEA